MLRFNFEDARGRYSILQLRKTGNADRRGDRPSMFYPIYSPDGEEILPIGPSGYESRWRFGKEKYDDYCKQDMIIWKKNKNGVATPYVKYYLEGRKKQVSNLWNDIDGNKKGTIELKSIFGMSNIFSNPKPIALVKRLIHICITDGIILDFFAGSSTTAHAVMQLNAEDGGNRQFIMVQLPEACDAQSEAAKAGYSTIAEISKERIRRAGKKILEGDCHEGWNRDVGFRVLKVDTSNMADVFYTPDALQQSLLDLTTDNIKPGRTPEDLLFQVLLDWGVELTLPIRKESIQGKTVFFVDDNALVACFDRGIDEALVRELAACAPLRVVFRDNGFVSDAVKINVEQIFRQLSPGTEVRCL